MSVLCTYDVYRAANVDVNKVYIYIVFNEAGAADHGVSEPSADL